MGLAPRISVFAHPHGRCRLHKREKDGDESHGENHTLACTFCSANPKLGGGLVSEKDGVWMPVKIARPQTDAENISGADRAVPAYSQPPWNVQNLCGFAAMEPTRVQ